MGDDRTEVLKHHMDEHPTSIELGNHHGYQNRPDVIEEHERRRCRPHLWIWNNRRLLICFGAPIILLPLPLVHPSTSGRCAYVVLLMGLYWMTEAIPMAATALIPMILFPALGIEQSHVLAPKYVNNATMVIMGGMLVAIAVEKWNLHKRCALRVLMLVGSKPKWLMFGFIFVTCFLSMWLSNTATTAMLIPILEAVLTELERHRNIQDRSPEEGEGAAIDTELLTPSSDVNTIKIPLGPNGDAGHMSNGHASPEKGQPDLTSDNYEKKPRKSASNEADFRKMCQGLSLCIIYGANFGGISTLTGTAPNLLLKSLVDEWYSMENPITYGTWLIFATPISWIACFIGWAWLVCYSLGWRELCFWRKEEGPQDNTAAKVIKNEYQKLGPITYAEVVVLIHFIVLVILWMARDPGFMDGWGTLFRRGYVSDGSVALLTAILLFILPSKRPSLRNISDSYGKASEPLLDWNSVHHRFPWGVMLLFGGGFAMAQGCEVSGLSADIGNMLGHLQNIPVWLLSLTLAFITMVATEIIDNTAAIAIVLPVVSKMADNLGLNPLRLMIPCTVACSFAFMLPVATLPAAIVYAYGRCNIADMVKAGALMNLLCIPVLQFAIYTWGTPYFDLNSYPEWAMKGNITEVLLASANTTTDIL